MEQRLIDGNKVIAVLQNIKNSLDGSPAKRVDMRAVILAAVDIIEEQPTIDPVHAAGACYCGECIKRNTPDCAMWYQCSICGGQWSWESDNVFCSFGERRKNTDDY